MGDESDDPQPGFHHWESFKGQGVYTGVTLNINGEHKYDDTVYTSDLLTEHAMNGWSNKNLISPFPISIAQGSTFKIQAGSTSCRNVFGKRLQITANLSADPR